jgi:hypothetical protein
LRGPDCADFIEMAALTDTAAKAQLAHIVKTRGNVTRYELHRIDPVLIEAGP